ncbi:zinc finger knuckle domain containing protein [Ophiostoma piceae UAMH 11346]|uniref:Zinc finger knuckle domain containing protein n=1 Tax=Ophiostoma piceae (strain UAMH 11346) TaxID=1262450 RepID=S3CBJ7_OPHP1|nr:zinc finger knuckle domain containing protein [Ophiostoma piceae UAMH 11346]
MAGHAPDHGQSSWKDPECYNCGIRGHQTIACPEPTRAVPAGLEAHLNRQASRDNNRMVVTRYPVPPPGSGPYPHHPPPPPLGLAPTPPPPPPMQSPYTQQSSQPPPPPSKPWSYPQHQQPSPAHYNSQRSGNGPYTPGTPSGPLPNYSYDSYNNQPPPLPPSGPRSAGTPIPHTNAPPYYNQHYGAPQPDYFPNNSAPSANGPPPPQYGAPSFPPQPPRHGSPAPPPSWNSSSPGSQGYPPPAYGTPGGAGSYPPTPNSGHTGGNSVRDSNNSNNWHNKRGGRNGSFSNHSNGQNQTQNNWQNRGGSFARGRGGRFSGGSFSRGSAGGPPLPPANGSAPTTPSSGAPPVPLNGSSVPKRVQSPPQTSMKPKSHITVATAISALPKPPGVPDKPPVPLSMTQGKKGAHKSNGNSNNSKHHEQASVKLEQTRSASSHGSDTHVAYAGQAHEQHAHKRGRDMPYLAKDVGHDVKRSRPSQSHGSPMNGHASTAVVHKSNGNANAPASLPAKPMLPSRPPHRAPSYGAPESAGGTSSTGSVTPYKNGSATTELSGYVTPVSDFRDVRDVRDAKDAPGPKTLSLSLPSLPSSLPPRPPVPIPDEIDTHAKSNGATPHRGRSQSRSDTALMPADSKGLVHKLVSTGSAASAVEIEIKVEVKVEIARP